MGHGAKRYVESIWLLTILQTQSSSIPFFHNSAPPADVWSKLSLILASDRFKGIMMYPLKNYIKNAAIRFGRTRISNMSASANRPGFGLADSIELSYQKYLLNVLMLIGIPVLGYFMIYDFIIGRTFVGLILALMFFLIFGLFVIINKPGYPAKKSRIYTYFLNILFILFGVFLAYTIGVEGSVSRIPWAFLFTVLIFFALGAARALILASALFFSLLILELYFPGKAQFLVREFKLRFYIAFMLVIMTSFFFERLKKKYQLQLIEHQHTLKESENRYREAFNRLNDEMNQRRKAEVALQASEEYYRALVENMPALICRFLPDGTLSFVNNAYCQYFKKEREELVGKNFFQFIPAKEQDNVRKHFESLTQQNPVVSYEHRVLPTPDDIRWQRWTDHAIFDDNGKVQQYQSIGIDITESKKAEQALRESEERFRELAELMPETVFEVDLEGKLTFVNRNAFSYFGYTRQDFQKGLNSFEMIVARERERARKNAAKILNGEKLDINEYTALRKDGSTFPVIIHSALIFKEGRPVGFRGFIVDITNRKKAEEEHRKLEVQFQQAQRFEAIATLAGGIAHDFNNLLMNIQGNTSLMLFDLDETHPYFEALKNIEKQVKSGAQLTRQMLGYARKGKFNVKPLDLNEIVDASANTFGRTRKEITIQREFENDLFPIEADQGQIEQVLLNLYVNAADAMPGGGKLFLKTKNQTHLNIKSNRYSPMPGNYVQLTVTDTGIGMDSQTLERIFDPFFTTKEIGRGTGLGLASVYGIVKSHDGYIDVKSEKGRGTTFTIFLPASQKAVKSTDKAASRLIKGSGTVLIVDDEHLVLDVSANMLEKLGYTVLKAQNGKEAVDIFAVNKGKTKMVILDIIMPDMGGGEVYEKIKAIKPEIKVLLASGYSVDGQAIELLERGCDGFIQKPFTMEELSAKIRQIMRK
jgi:two-component system cell cycle sensor histidine kinase/response regulator CckA